jgi:hypothetical protein
MRAREGLGWYGIGGGTLPSVFKAVEGILDGMGETLLLVFKVRALVGQVGGTLLFSVLLRAVGSW